MGEQIALLASQLQGRQRAMRGQRLGGRGRGSESELDPSSSSTLAGSPEGDGNGDRDGEEGVEREEAVQAVGVREKKGKLWNRFSRRMGIGKAQVT